MLSNGETSTEAGYRFGEFRLDPKSCRLYRLSEAVSLGPKPFRVLVFLIENRDRVVPISELLEKVWEERREVGTVHQTIRHLRKALGDDAANPTFIEAVSGHGYRFIASVSRSTQAIDENVEIVSVGAEFPDKSGFWRRRYFVLALIAVGVMIAAVWLRIVDDPKLVHPVRITHTQARILSPLLTDGSRVYYGQIKQNRSSVAQVAAGGGETVTLPVGLPNPELCDLSADGGWMLLRGLDHTLSREGDKPLYVQPVVGGEMRKVGDVLAYDAGWYPDAQHILFSIGGAVYRCDRAGAGSRRLFTVPGNAYWFRWAPDGKRFRFTVIESHTEATSIWEADAQGSSVRRLFPEWDNERQQCCGSWTPDGKLFLFQFRDRSNFQVMARHENSGLFSREKPEPVQLTAGPMNYRSPLASSDGTKVFVRTEFPKSEIVQFDLKSRRFVTLPPAISARTADFSKDGEWIAYGSLTDNNLWRCKTDGSQLLQLTFDFQQVAMPHWSRNGRSLAFMGRRWGKKWGIFIVSAAGGKVEPLSTSDKGEADPDWSPDDSQLVFGNLLEEPRDAAIYTVDLGDRRTHALPESAGYFSPRWSPDGRFIAAVHISDGRLDVFDLASKKWTNLTKLSCGYPSWSHNGKFLYFLSSPDGQRGIWRVGLADHKTEMIASLSEIEQPSTIFGTWIGLAPDDSPLALRNLTTEDIYAWTLADR